MMDKKDKAHPTVVSTAEVMAELGDPSTWDKDEEEFQKKFKAKPEIRQTTETVEAIGFQGNQTLTFAVDDYDSSVTLSKTEGTDQLGTILLYEDQIKVVIEKLTEALKRFETHQ